MHTTEGMAHRAPVWLRFDYRRIGHERECTVEDRGQSGSRRIGHERECTVEGRGQSGSRRIGHERECTAECRGQSDFHRTYCRAWRIREF
jgi:hypothetical protein